MTCKVNTVFHRHKTKQISLQLIYFNTKLYKVYLNKTIHIRFDVTNLVNFSKSTDDFMFNGTCCVNHDFAVKILFLVKSQIGKNKQQLCAAGGL